MGTNQQNLNTCLNTFKYILKTSKYIFIQEFQEKETFSAAILLFNISIALSF